MLALGIGPGDEVLVPAYTFPATANVVALAGATPVLVDVDPETINLDLDRVYEAVTPRTRAVLAVHLFGRPLDWEALQSAVPPELVLLEDAAGALGARWRGMPCGGLGALGCLSFHPRKIVTTGEGGAVTTDDAELADAVRRLRHHGSTPAARHRRSPSSNYRLPDVLCAIGIPQLRRLEELLAARDARRRGLRGAAARRRRAPSADEGDRTAGRPTSSGSTGATRRCRRCARRVSRRRSAPTRCTGSRAYRDQGPFPGADAAFERALALPFHSRLTEADLDRVAEASPRFA